MVVFTIVPNKELAYAEKVRRDGIEPPEAYRLLVRDEALNIRELAQALGGLPGAAYVDVVGPLQQAALGPMPVYSPSWDGHPRPAGYAVIARALAAAVGPLLPDPPAEGLLIEARPDAPGQGDVVLLRYGGVWRFADRESFSANGWALDLDRLPRYTERDLAGLPFLGYVTEALPARFGPRPAAP